MPIRGPYSLKGSLRRGVLLNESDLIVMGAVSSAVIVNTNKNENNNNNNDLQASLGSVTSNVQMASADQSSTQGAMIIVSPVGVPSVIPTGEEDFRSKSKPK